MDSTSFLYYIGAAHVIFIYKNSQKGMIDKRMFFDKDLNVVSKYSIIHKVATTDNLKNEPQTYEPFTPEEYEQFATDRILKYY